MTATTDARRAEAQRLRAEGRTYRQIGERLGVASSTVQRWLKPDYAERQRATSLAWKQRNRDRTRAYDHDYGREHRGQCVRCGGQMGIRIRRNGVCEACRSAAAHERSLRIVKWWAEGKTLPAIAAELGWSMGHVQVEFDRMRAAGYHLPYRYRGYSKFPELAA